MPTKPKYTGHIHKVKKGKYQSIEGTFHPINQDKFLGKRDPIYKSRLEQRMMIFLDKSASVVSWNYEPRSAIIDYIDPTKWNKQRKKGRPRKYYIDFVVDIRVSDTEVKRKWIEVKSYKETKKPTHGKKKSKRNIKLDEDTWIRNNAKWNSARRSAKRRDYEFVIITEKQLK